MQHLIIGTGPAGVTAAETLRRLDPAAGVRLIGAEPEPPYSRMAIPYLLMERIGEPGTYLRARPEHYARLGIEIGQGRVCGIDTAARAVQLADGTRHAYDRLLLATGATPVRPPIPGIELPGVHSCWTLPDARCIQAGAARGSRVTLIGAGFIGSIILEALAQRGVQLTVIEQGERMVPRMLGPAAGAMIRRWCEGKGVRVYTGARVQAIEQAPDGLRVVLGEGAPVDADLVISATGVRPNVGFLDGTAVQVRQGVLVDRHFRTSIPEREERKATRSRRIVAQRKDSEAARMRSPCARLRSKAFSVARPCKASRNCALSLPSVRHWRRAWRAEVSPTSQRKSGISGPVSASSTAEIGSMRRTTTTMLRGTSSARARCGMNCPTKASRASIPSPTVAVSSPAF